MGFKSPQTSTSAATWNPNALSPHWRAQPKSPGGLRARKQLQRADAGFTPPRSPPGIVLGLSPHPHPARPLPVLRGLGLGTQTKERLLRSPWFSLWREGLGGLGLCFDRGLVAEGRAVAVYFGFSLSFVQMLLPCAPHPPASLGLRLSRNLSEKLSKKLQAPPPPPSQSMRPGRGGKLRARVRV